LRFDLTGDSPIGVAENYLEFRFRWRATTRQLRKANRPGYTKILYWTITDPGGSGWAVVVTGAGADIG
jgi:hypothetical protein